MELDLLVLLVCGAVATSALSAVVGFGGGVVLLLLLVIWFDPLDAIAIHGAIQISSNGSRAIRQRAHIEWSIVAQHARLLAPAGVGGYIVASLIPTDLGRALIGAFALLGTWKPQWMTAKNGNARLGFVGVGALQGFLNIPLGATGPLIAPFFRSALPSRHAMIGRFAATQTLGHVTKVAIIGVGGTNLAGHLDVIVLGSAAVIAGTWLGSLVVDRISEPVFDALFRTALTVMAIRLIIGAVWPNMPRCRQRKSATSSSRRSKTGTPCGTGRASSAQV